MTKFIKFFFPVLISFFIFSCYTQKIEMNADKKSGKMTIEYFLNNDYFQLISIVASNFQYEDDNYFDTMILIDESMFKENFKKYDGISLDSVSIKKIKEGEYKGKIVISFKDFEKSLQLMPKGMTGLEIKKEDKDYTVTQIMDFKKMDPDDVFKNFVDQLKEDDIAFYKLLTEEAFFQFELYTKSNIKKSEGVKIGDNGKSAKYSFKVKELLDKKNQILKFMISF